MEAVFFNVIARKLGFKDYGSIMDLYANGDLGKKFQELFNTYYRIRRNEEWRSIYYKYFAELKAQPAENITYDAILDKLAEMLPKTKNGNAPVEASFASKMLATINPDKPILDSQVMANMGLKIRDNLSVKEKIKAAKDVYAEIDKRYQSYEKTEDCKRAIELFDKYFPTYKNCYTVTKKIDWFMWSFAHDELVGMGIFTELLGD